MSFFFDKQDLHTPWSQASEAQVLVDQGGRPARQVDIGARHHQFILCGGALLHQGARQHVHRADHLLTSSQGPEEALPAT